MVVTGDGGPTHLPCFFHASYMLLSQSTVSVLLDASQVTPCRAVTCCDVLCRVVFLPTAGVAQQGGVGV
jgi:hypothetical protein